MEAVSLKLEDTFLHDIEKTMRKHRYTTKTEFIREAVRDKLAELSKEELMSEFLKFRGKTGKKTTYIDNLKTKQAVGKELMEELGKRFS